MLGIYQQLQERNARETLPFVAVHEANATLLNQVDALQKKCDDYEREVSILQQQVDDKGNRLHVHSRGSCFQAKKRPTAYEEDSRLFAPTPCLK